MSVYKDILTELARRCSWSRSITERWEDELSGEGMFTVWFESRAGAVFLASSFKSKHELIEKVEERARYELLMDILEKGIKHLEEQGAINALFNSNNTP